MTLSLTDAQRSALEAELNGKPPPTVRFQTTAELRASTPVEPEWLWRNYIAAGNLVLLAGKPKAGKSTLAFALTNAIATGAAAFIGEPIRQTAVVYVSEEGASTLLPKLGPNHAPVHVLTRENAWPKPPWPELVTAAVAHARDTRARLLVIDTAAYWTALPAEREKDAGAVQAAMQPLVEAARAGIATLLVHHARKAGGEDGDAVRGSSGWAGSADTILELERPDDDAAAPGQRLLLALSRYPDTPPALLLDRDANTGAWGSTGQAASRRDARGATARAILLDALPPDPHGMTRAEIEDETQLPSQRLHAPLKELCDSGQVTRTGAGRKGDPYRYGKLPTDSAHNAGQKAGRNTSGDGSLSAALPLREEQKQPHPPQTAHQRNGQKAAPQASIEIVSSRAVLAGANGSAP